MRYILAARSRPLLEKFASGKVLLAFDFDGTLAPITNEPDGTEIRGTTRNLLQKLTLQYPCIVVSGRGRADVQRRLRGIGFEEVIGNHGIEPWGSTPLIARTVKAWMPLLERRLKIFQGVTIEDKRFSISVHYRKTRNKKEAIKFIKRIGKTLSGAHLFGGKQVINIVPESSPNKGDSVERERQSRHCDHVIHVGDDETDETVFALKPSRKFLGIRVGLKRSSRARFYIRNQGEIDRLLRLLLDVRLHKV